MAIRREIEYKVKFAGIADTKSVFAHETVFTDFWVLFKKEGQVVEAYRAQAVELVESSPPPAQAAQAAPKTA